MTHAHNTQFLSQCDPLSGCGKVYPADLTDCPKCGVSGAFSIRAPVDPRVWGYDIETYPNCFTATFIHAHTGMIRVFEISDRKNERDALVNFMMQLKHGEGVGVGFNNIHFDYPVIHYIANTVSCDVTSIYSKAMSMIGSSDRYGSTVWDNEHIFTQLDLFKIWHFDNGAKSTSLKALEISMNSNSVVDLPFALGVNLDDTEKDVLIQYNIHDVVETLKFYARSLSEISLRESLSEKYGVNMLNFSNTKIGSTILTGMLERSGVQCYVRDGVGRRASRQTIRSSVNLGSVIFPHVKLERSEFTQIVDFLHSVTLLPHELQENTLKTKGVFTSLSATLDGFTFVFGVGGIHGSISSQTVASCDDYQIVDADVTSFYPRLAIVNKMYPDHLGVGFCHIYNEIFEARRSHPKGTPENAALKESLNASYGNSNNQFSPLYDSRYTMQTTINGQLMLCMLAEQLMKIPNLSMIQANTDGLTYRCPRVYLEHASKVCAWWEAATGLQLEYANYSRMFIRDVNNYIAEYEGGKLKRKGAYEYNTLWHQDPSAKVVAMAAEAALVHGVDVRHFICNHKNKFDFTCRAKVPRDSSLIMRYPEFGVDVKLQNTTRYFVSNTGGQILKLSPPTGKVGTWKRRNGVDDTTFDAIQRELRDGDGEIDSDGIRHDVRIHTKNKSKHQLRTMSLCSGWSVTDCADIKDFDWGNVNFEWYISEAEKLVNPVKLAGLAGLSQVVPASAAPA